MALRALTITLSGSAQQVSAAITSANPTFLLKARWITFQNIGGAIVTVGDSGVSATNGIVLVASNAANSVYSPPVPTANPSSGYDLSQWYVIGTSSNKLQILYDDMTF